MSRKFPKRQSTGLPVRRYRKGSYLSITGKVPTPHAQFALYHESPREEEHLILLAFDDRVARVQTHPFTIEYMLEGRRRTYTPDALVEFRPDLNPPRKTELREIKTTSMIEKNREEWLPKFAAIRTWAQQNGYWFRVLTEKQLPRQRVANCRFLLRYRGHPGYPTIEARLLEHLARLRTVSVERLIALGAAPDCSRDRALALIWRLLAFGYLRTDLDQPLGLGATLELARG